MKTLISILLLITFTGFVTESKPQPHPISHEIWNELLQKHVDETGKVDYEGFLNDRKKLKEYLDLLRSNAPAETWPRDEKMAYWINAYNAFTIDLIIQNWPVKSIKDIGSKFKIQGVNSPWDIKFIDIQGKKYNLSSIENKILRGQFKEPRIHFAIVCASRSCPRLLNEAYTADKLENQLYIQARNFINDERKNHIAPDKLELSQIFNWFKGDFTKQKTLVAFVQQYTNVKINADANISYLEYDWSLND